MEVLQVEKFKTGTTTIGLVAKDAVILAADQRASMGNLVATKRFHKVYKVSGNMAMTLAGVVGDAQMMVRLLRAELRLYELQEKRLTVRAGATLMANVLRGAYKHYSPELVQLILGGFDERGPQLFSLDPTGSVILEDEYTFSGSGSPVALGVLEDNYKKNISVDDAVHLIIRALRAAKDRDTFTGPADPKAIDVAIVTKKGVELLSEEKIAKMVK